MNSIEAVFQIVIVPLVLTILVELGVWKLIQLSFKKYLFQYLWLSIIAINLATNPAFNIISSILDPTRTLIFLELGFEILIIFVEAIILYLIYKKQFSKFLLLSGSMNLVSYGVGLILISPSWF